jgi:hypothetical protein
MCIVVDDADDFVGLGDHQPACACRPEYAYRKDGTRIDRHRIDPFCAIHGYHYRREIASAFNRSFNRRRYFSNFIFHLGPDEDAGLESWAKGYVTDLIRGYFDKDAIIKIVLHPKDGDYHLHVGVGSDVGHVTLAAILSVKSPRGRKPRLDLSTAWVDGYLHDRRWNWCAYVLRVEEGWRDDEWVNRRQRRSWRSRADRGERINAPTFSGRDEWYGADDVIADDGAGVEEAVRDTNGAVEAGYSNRRVEVEERSDSLVQPTLNVVNWLGWCLNPALRWMARKWLDRCIHPHSSVTPRISTAIWGNKDGKVGESRSMIRFDGPLARPPPEGRCRPLLTRGHDVLDRGQRMASQVYIYGKLPLERESVILVDDLEDFLGPAGEVTGKGSGLAGWNIDIELGDGESVWDWVPRLLQFLRDWGIPRDAYLRVFPPDWVEGTDGKRVNVYD